MIIRQFQRTQYAKFHQSLKMKAHADPLEACYTVHMTINEVEYAVKIQPEGHNQMAVLQARRMVRGADGPVHELITQGNLLSSLMEILIEQGVS